MSFLPFRFSMSSSDNNFKLAGAFVAGAGALYAFNKFLDGPRPGKTVKLTYFGLPGRAELARLAFAYGGIAFEDRRVTGDEWKVIKEAAPVPIQLPMLEVDGTRVFQSIAIARYAGTLAGLIPSDPLLAAASDNLIDNMEDVLKPFFATFALKGEGEKEAARAILCAEGGPVRVQVGRLPARCPPAPTHELTTLYTHPLT